MFRLKIIKKTTTKQNQNQQQNNNQNTNDMYHIFKQEQNKNNKLIKAQNFKIYQRVFFLVTPLEEKTRER